ncbi:MAG TPA: ornithine carbamoyltransferase [Candidatus Bathyarchaeia archaeon]|nr:ornithine carbamoyltransferase [Candidatus Bathyarchaeia archaeon]
MSIRGRDFLTLQDYTAEELWQILKISKHLKERALLGEHPDVLRGRSLAMIFQKPSTRTRVSFEIAMNQLGGHVLNLSANELQLGRGETVADTAKVMSRYVDGIMARVYSHNDLLELAAHANIPVINGLSDLFHPCQALADLFTIWEKKGDLEGLKLSFVGDGNNVCNSLLVGCSKLGLDMAVACPKGYEPDGKVLQWAKTNSERTGTTITITREPSEAVEGADVIYTDVIVSMGQDVEKEKKLKTFLPTYQVNSDLLAKASREAVFMHCLPAHRGEEVTDDVIDGPQSVVWDQAENRMHAQKGVLALLI